MINSGLMSMPLHFGKMPKWLSERMGKMGFGIVESVIQNYGKSEVLTRFSDPNWFQALGAVMGMQWNSSGVTATVLGALKRKVNPAARDLGIYILGGKGRYGWNTPSQIQRVSNYHGLDGVNLMRSSELTRRVDNNAIMDGYSLYQNYFILSDDGDWTGITQGMNTSNRRARRYHWHSPNVKSFVSEPHVGIVGENEGKIMNLIDGNAISIRNNIVELATDSPHKVLKEIKAVDLPNRHNIQEKDLSMKRLGSVLQLAYNRQIDNFEDLLLLKGVGPRTLKALALTSEVIHGDSSRFDDPSRFSFAVGGKDGVPHPVDTEAYDETINMLQDSVEKAKIGDKEKSKAIKRLHRAAKTVESKYTPSAFLSDLIDFEWDNAEKNGGMTFMGKTISGLTKAITKLQNPMLYGDKNEKN